MKKKILASIVLMFVAVLAISRPASRESFLITQPDGTTFMARFKGDEFSRVLTTTDGCALMKDSDGFYQYAFYNADGTTTGSGYRPGDKVPALVLNESRNIPYEAIRFRGEMRRIELARRSKHRTLRTKAEGRESRHCLVILVQFPDLKFQNENSRKDEFTALVTERGYSRDGATGSVLDYFSDQLGHLYDFDFTVSDIVTASKSYRYYGEDINGSGDDAHPDELAKEACMLVDPFIDFSQYDDDGDGEVDNVYIIVAGCDEAEGGDADYIWPHQWYIRGDHMVDGKKLGNYAMSTELSVRSRTSTGSIIWGMAQIGSICHEYSHVLGLLDMYDTDGEKSGGSSDCLWYQTAVMDGGSYNNGSKTPPGYNAVDYELLGAGNPEKLAVGSYTLEPVSKDRHYLIHENPKDEFEFFLFECRDNSGWDRYIGGSGLAIYHIDMSGNAAGYSESEGKEVSALFRWQMNQVNCNPAFQCADMVETTDKPINVKQAFYPFQGKTSFTVSTSPSFTFNDGTPSGLSISGIKIEGNKVSFDVYDSGIKVPAAKDIIYEVYQDAVIITWESDIPGYTDKAEVTWGQTSKSMKTVSVDPYEPGKYSITLEGLSPVTPYSVDIQFRKGSITGDKKSFDLLTKSYKSGSMPYIFLSYLDGDRVGGRFKAGTGFPLRVMNAIGADVVWKFGGRVVTVDGSGYFHPAESGTLSAHVSDGNGKTIITKEISIAR